MTLDGRAVEHVTKRAAVCDDWRKLGHLGREPVKECGPKLGVGGGVWDETKACWCCTAVGWMLTCAGILLLLMGKPYMKT